jgi:hypothetical protein
MAKIQFFSVDFTKALPGPCLFGHAYAFSTQLYTIAAVALAIYLLFWVVVKLTNSERPRQWAKDTLAWLPFVLFLAYPGFSAFFFAALKCRRIDRGTYIEADLSIICDGAEYTRLYVCSVVFVVVWGFGLPVGAVRLLWPQRSKLQEGVKPGGVCAHLEDFYQPFKPQFWFFEAVEFAKKLLLIGVVPAISGNLMGALVALLLVAVYLALLLALSPYVHLSDQFLAVCVNSLLFIVVLVSVLLKMDAPYITGEAADGLDQDTASWMLIASNVLVMAMSLVAYCVSVTLRSKERVLLRESEAKSHQCSSMMGIFTEPLNLRANEFTYEEMADPTTEKDLSVTADDGLDDEASDEDEAEASHQLAPFIQFAMN